MNTTTIYRCERDGCDWTSTAPPPPPSDRKDYEDAPCPACAGCVYDDSPCVEFTDGSLGIVDVNGMIRIKGESKDADYVNTLISEEHEYRDHLATTLVLAFVLTFAVAFAAGFYTASAVAADMVLEAVK